MDVLASLTAEVGLTIIFLRREHRLCLPEISVPAVFVTLQLVRKTITVQYATQTNVKWKPEASRAHYENALFREGNIL